MDFPLSVYFTSGFLMLLIFMRTADKSYLILSALLTCSAVWTKNEGIMLGLVNIFTLAFYLSLLDKRRLKDRSISLLLYSLPIITIYIIWYLFIGSLGVYPSADQALHLSEIFSNLYRVPVIAGIYMQKCFVYGNWNIAWFLLFVTVSFSTIRMSFSLESIYSLLGVSLCVSVYSLVYYLSNSYAFLLDGTTVNRNFLTFMPLVIYCICSNISLLLAGKKEKRK
jgi:hypothetical protein